MTATFTAVCPSIVPAHTQAMLASCKFPVDVIDNTHRNRGVSASWNQGVRLMRDRGDGWLVIVSSSVRFGAPGGCDLIAALDAECVAVEGAPHLGWHLIAFRADVFDVVGLFDPHYMPGYLEDTDMAHRISLGFGLNPPYWRKVDVDATLTGYGEAVAATGIDVQIDRLIAYEAHKWNGHPGDPDADLFTTPFGLDVPLSWHPPLDDPRGTYPLEWPDPGRGTPGP